MNNRSTMKNYFLLILVITISINTFSQNFLKVQSYNVTKPSPKKTPVSDSSAGAAQLVNTTSAGISSSVSPSIYAIRRDKYKKAYDSLLQSATSEYDNKQRAINESGSSPDEQQTAIDNLNKQFETIQKELKAKYQFYSRQNDYLAKTLGHSNYFFVKYAEDAIVFYNAEIQNKYSSIFKNSNLIFGTNGNTVSLYNELYADYFGPVRFGMGVLVSNAQTSSPNGIIDTNKVKQDATQILMGGGGNAIFSLSYPFLSL